MMPRGIDAVRRRSNQFRLDAINPTHMPIMVAVAIGIVLLSLAVLDTSLLRIATASLYTVSIRTFIPPDESI